MGFETKKALLEYLGKNSSDNKLIDRMIRRGEIRLEDGMYYIVESEEVIRLRKEVEELKKSDLRGELEVAKAQWDYYMKMAEDEREDKERKIEKAFRWIKGHVKGANWEEFYEWLMSDEE